VELFLVATIANIVTQSIENRAAMLGGLALLPACVALLLLAQALGSMAILLAGTTLTGIAAALGYRGSLQVVNQIAPADRRAEVVSSYLVACYVGNSLPVIGVGIVATVVDPVTASVAFAVTIAFLALAALATGKRYAPKT
jgi:MFS family permease